MMDVIRSNFTRSEINLRVNSSLPGRLLDTHSLISVSNTLGKFLLTSFYSAITWPPASRWIQPNFIVLRDKIRLVMRVLKMQAPNLTQQSAEGMIGYDRCIVLIEKDASFLLRTKDCLELHLQYYREQEASWNSVINKLLNGPPPIYFYSSF